MTRRLSLQVIVPSAALLVGLVVAQDVAGQDRFPTTRPAIEPKSTRSTAAGELTDVLVLGAAHLQRWPDFQPAWAGAILDKLVRYHPTIVAVEDISGPGCDALRRYAMINPGAYADYCRPSVEAQAATGMDVPTAYAMMETMLAAWPDRPTPAARRRLASVMIAAGERSSALVQWLRLPEAERRAADSLTADMAKRLADDEKLPNESQQIGSRLAARLGLERVYAIDDHSADAVQSSDLAAKAASDAAYAGTISAEARRIESLPHSTPEELLAVYRGWNAPAAGRAGYMDVTGRPLQYQAAPAWGRRIVAWHELRNLRMAANVREAFATSPGARVLVVVGSNHKPYLESYLDQMADVRLVDADAVLR